jgi:hypothetical protein
MHGPLDSATRFGAAAVRLLLVASVLDLCSACARDDSGAAVPRVERILAECAKVSVCTGLAANACFAIVSNKDSWDPFEVGADRRQIELRAGCMAKAESCDQVLSCIDQASQAFADEQSALAARASCELAEDYTYCGDGLLVWCFLGEYDTEATPIPLDLDALGKTCNAAGSYCADPGHPTCDGEDNSRSCDGVGAVQCAGGESTSWDCREIDPEFVCTIEADEPERPLCTLPEEAQECERGNYTNAGDWGVCEGNVARICAGRKFYEVDCSAFLGASCVQEDNSTEFPEVFCEI